MPVGGVVAGCEAGDRFSAWHAALSEGAPVHFEPGHGGAFRVDLRHGAHAMSRPNDFALRGPLRPCQSTRAVRVPRLSTGFLTGFLTGFVPRLPPLVPALSALSALSALACNADDARVLAVDAATEDAAAGTADAATDADAGPGVACPGEAPVSYAWAPPAVARDACSESDLDRLRDAIAGRRISTASDLATALGPACAACAIGARADAAWKAVIADREGYLGNVGGCVVRLGGTETCGRAIDHLSICLIVGCAGCRTRNEQDRCGDKLTSVDGACTAFLREVRGACSPGQISAGFSSGGVCQSFVDTIRLFCGPSAGDAGTDGGVNGGADGGADGADGAAD
jgi:hypothetical protein